MVLLAGNQIDADSPLDAVLNGGLVDATLTLDTAIYASGDVLSNTAALTNAMRANGGRALIRNITVIDADDQGQALDVLFFSANKSLGTKNAAPNISDADALDCCGLVQVVAGDYSDLGGVRVATKVLAQGLVVKAAAASRNIYVATICRSGTPTYTANGLTLRIGYQHL